MLQKPSLDKKISALEFFVDRRVTVRGKSNNDDSDNEKKISSHDDDAQKKKTP